MEEITSNENMRQIELVRIDKNHWRACGRSAFLVCMLLPNILPCTNTIYIEQEEVFLEIGLAEIGILEMRTLCLPTPDKTKITIEVPMDFNESLFVAWKRTIRAEIASGCR